MVEKMEIIKDGELVKSLKISDKDFYEMYLLYATVHHVQNFGREATFRFNPFHKSWTVRIKSNNSRDPNLALAISRLMEKIDVVATSPHQ